MRKTGIILLFLALASATPVPGVQAATFSCGGGIISSGDRSIDVLAKCGPPDSKESHQEELSEKLDDTAKQKVFINVEEWTYNFGPTQFTRFIILKNGVVTDIRTGNYGYAKPTEPAERECSEQILSLGDSKTDVLAKCGEPALKNSHVEEFKEKSGDTEKTLFVTVEEWTYNLGPSRFMRILTFRNSTLTDIRTGRYGY
jgi:hypothetical protein